MAAITFGQLVADRVDRVEGRHRLLEDHGDPVAAHTLRDAAVHQILAREGQTPRSPPRAARQEIEDAERRHRLAAAGFADEAEGLAAPDRQRHVADGMQHSACGRQVDAEAFDLEECVHARPSGDRASRNPSPARLIAKTSSAKAVPGMAMSQKLKNM